MLSQFSEKNIYETHTAYNEVERYSKDTLIPYSVHFIQLENYASVVLRRD